MNHNQNSSVEKQRGFVSITVQKHRNRICRAGCLTLAGYIVLAAGNFRLSLLLT